jgi:two-component system, NtrC family, response regulator AtoC
MKEKKTVLIVDDEASMRKNISDILASEGFGLLEAADGLEAIEKTKKHHPELILMDINLPKLDGISALRQIRNITPEVVVIAFTAFGTSERAIEAMKAGAYDYLEKPFELDEFLLIIRRALQYKDLLGEVTQLRTQVSRASPPKRGEGEIIGTSGKMQELFKLIGRVAPTDATVMIQGESGTGKELIADAIQRHSIRKEKPFVKVNCGALPETLLESEMFGHEKGAFTGSVGQHQGRFELANGGTIFLDEVNNMPPSLQMKLLRVLQQKTFERVGGKETLTVDVRVIAGTNKNIEEEMKSGRFREDLYYRLNVIHVKVPPLRDHPEDIPSLVEHFLEKYSPVRRAIVSADVMRKLQAYSWPGNIRELENVIQRSIVMAQGDAITIEDLPLALRAEGDLVPKDVIWQDGVPMYKILADIEKQLILKALNETNWNRTKAAQLLQIHRRQLFSKMKEFNITPRDNE